MSVVAYIDGSQFTESICLHTAWASRQLGAPVDLVYLQEFGTSDLMPIEDRLTRAGSEHHEERIESMRGPEQNAGAVLRDDQRELLLEAARELRRHGVERIHSSIEHGTLEEDVRSRSHETHLIVLGKRGMTSSARTGELGGHLEGVIRGASSPILIAPSEPRVIRRFLIAFDGSPHTGNAIRYLVENPLLTGCEGIILLAGNHPGNHHQLHDATSHLRSAGYDVQAEIGRGAPESIIPDIVNAEDIDLLVMGAFGHSRLHTLFGGSTTRRILRSSSKAILTVR